MNMKKYLMMAAVAAAMTFGFAACSSDDDADNTVVNGSQAALDKACTDCEPFTTMQTTP